MASREFNQWKADMVAAQLNSSPVDIKNFTTNKPVHLFEALKNPQFSGQLQLKTPEGKQWTLYLYSGRIVYAAGGKHPNRRWKRNLTIHCPTLLANGSNWKQDLESVATQGARTAPGWQYQLLCSWKSKRKISQESIDRLIRAGVEEILFDIAQTPGVTYEIKSQTLPFPKLAFVDVDRSIAVVQKHWRDWQTAKVADRSPNHAPIICQPEQLRRCVSIQTYQTLTKRLDGQQTLRDLAVQMKRNSVDILQSLLPYIQRSFVDLVEVADLPNPTIGIPAAQSSTTKQSTAKQTKIGHPATKRPTSSNTAIAQTTSSNTAIKSKAAGDPPDRKATLETSGPKKPLIACVDDSPMICQTLGDILTAAGYQFMALNDALRAIVSLMMHKPDLIFLDLVMPDANGYEICSQLRKLSFFRTIPIIILTGNDGIIDRVRAKMVGSSDFLSKPIDAEIVLNVVQKYLKHPSPT